MLLESVEAKDQDRCRFVKLKLILCLSVFLALRTVPAVAFTKVLWSSELPKTLVDRLFLLHKVRLFLRGDHSWMSDEIHELVHFICLLFYFKVLLQEKDLKLKSLICFLLFGFD